ncbi:MAG TPA: arginase family protein [Cyclobacteriaceae bacterium]|nr:arginase family protein [Cyclobacteriaceae bacterium]
MISGSIHIISAPSILGLRPTGVEKLPESLLSAGLRERLNVTNPVTAVRTLNDIYSPIRDRFTRCLNTQLITQFSKKLAQTVRPVVTGKSFVLILGGDCSILIGVMLGLKTLGNFGLLFIDAHADFYSPEASITGEVADMDLAMVCGRGPGQLTNIDKLGPYVQENHVIHVGQRDLEETLKYCSPDIAQTQIKRFDFPFITKHGIDQTIIGILDHTRTMNVDGYWIHFDTDSLSDDLNPAVDYRLPGGLSFEEVELVCNRMIANTKVVGMSVTCFNPNLDKTGKISGNIMECIGRMLYSNQLSEQMKSST